MKKRNNVLLLITIGLVLVSCSSQDQRTLSPEEFQQLARDLESEEKIEKETPFVKRNFNPYLSGEWAGDAVSYGCYRKGQAPDQNGPNKEEILEDLKIISQYWNMIRVYNADDDTERILEVIRENDLPVKMVLGIWLAKEEDNPERKKKNIANVLRGIELTQNFTEQIIAVNAGNETQVYWSWHKMDTDRLITYIRAVRNNVRVPVSTSDDYNFWNKAESKTVAAEIDFIMTHIHPQWNGQTLDTAIPWQDSTFKDIEKRHPQKTVILAETGWATTYNPDKKGPGEQGTLIKGEVSVAAQQQFLSDLNKWIHKNKITTFLFEAFDEPWKGGGEASGPNEIEKHWGVFYENRTAKGSFKNYINKKSLPQN